MPRSRPSRRAGRDLTDRQILRGAAWLVAAVAVIGAALFAGSLVFSHDADPSGSSATAPVSPLSSPTPSTSTAPSPSPTASPSATPTQEQLTRAGMEQFVDSYLDAVTDDPARAWPMLTTGFQNTSGGFGDYRDFWAPISRAVPSQVSADPAAATISYQVRYTYADGRTRTDRTRLTLQLRDGTYRISGEG